MNNTSTFFLLAAGTTLPSWGLQVLKTQEVEHPGHLTRNLELINGLAIDPGEFYCCRNFLQNNNKDIVSTLEKRNAEEQLKHLNKNRMDEGGWLLLSLNPTSI